MSIIPDKNRKEEILIPGGADALESALVFLSRWDHLEIEIGSGNGHFLAEYGKRNPLSGLVGIELKTKRCEKIQKKLNTSGIKNVHVFQGDAALLLGRLAPSSVDAFHIYFPDPWPKTKHRKRRFIKQSVLLQLFSLLKKSGRIHFTSDIFDYYLQVKLLALADGRFVCVENGVPEEIIHSLYARKTSLAGNEPHSLTLAKKSRLTE